MISITRSHTFEEAIALTGNGGLFHWRLLGAVGFGVMGVVAEGMSMGFVLPVAKCELQISNVEQGMINAVAFVGVVLTSHLWGFFADTWGRVKVLRLSLLLGFVCSAMSSLSTSSTMLMITRFMVGLSVSGMQAASISYLGEFHGNANRTRWVTFGVMFMPLAVVYQPAIGLIIMPHPSWQFNLFGMVFGTWRLFIICTSSILAWTFVATMLLPESPKFLMAMGRETEALSVLRWIYEANGEGRAKDYPVRTIAPENLGSSISGSKNITEFLRLLWNQTHPVFRPPYVLDLLMLFFISISCYVASHGFFMWAPQIFSFYLPRLDEPITICQAVREGIAQINLSEQIRPQNESMLYDIENADKCQTDANDTIGYSIIILMGIVFFLCYLLIVLIKFSTKIMLTIWMLLCAISAIVMLWTTNFYLNVALMTAMMSSGNCGGILSAFAADFFPTHYKSMALSLVFMFGRIGAVIGSNIVAALLESHCEWIFGINAILLVGAGVICLVLLKRSK